MKYKNSLFRVLTENIARLEWTLNANIINEPQLDYCVRNALYTRTVSSQRAGLSLVTSEKTMQTNENKGFEPYFMNTLYIKEKVVQIELY